MRTTLAALFMPSSLAVRFAIKSVLSAMIALWIAMRFDLAQPQWALMTTFVVAQPLSGMVLQKGLARLLGTILGGSMSVLLMALGAQAPWLFLLGMAVWVGLCSGTSTQLRSAWAYTFVLGGYTVAIIGIPAIDHPLNIFNQAVARCTEIGLGIICASVVSAVLWPQRVGLQMVGQARDALTASLQGTANLLTLAEVSREGLLGSLGRLLAVDAQREHAWFEGRHGRSRARAMRSLSLSLLGISRVSRSVARIYRSLDEEAAHALQPWFSELSTLFQTLPEIAAVEALGERLQHYRETHPGCPERDGLARLSVLLRHVLNALRALQGVERGEWPGEGGMTPLAGHRDASLALVFGLRTGCALVAVASFWLATAWTHATGAMLLTAVVCSLFASRDNAVQIGYSFLRGILMAVPVAFAIGHLVLPQISGFPLLAMALGVPLFLGALCMAKPPIAGTATSFSLHFIILIAPPNHPSYDAEFFLNEAVGMVIGVLCAVLAFRLIHLRNPHWQAGRLLRATLDDLGRLTERSLMGAEGWFGGRMADRLLQLARYHPYLPADSRSRWDDGLFGLDLGDELLHLRLCLAHLGMDSDAQVRQLMERLAGHLRKGPLAGGGALDEVLTALDVLLEARPPGEERDLARTAVAQLKTSWRQWCAEQEVVHGLA